MALAYEKANESRVHKTHWQSLLKLEGLHSRGGVFGAFSQSIFGEMEFYPVRYCCPHGVLRVSTAILAQSPSPELFQRMVDALHIQDTLHIFQRESWKRPGFSLFQIQELIRCIASPKNNNGSVFTFQSRALRGDEADYAELYDLVVLKDVSVEQGPIIPRFNQLSKVFRSCSLKISKNWLRREK